MNCILFCGHQTTNLYIYSFAPSLAPQCFMIAIFALSSICHLFCGDFAWKPLLEKGCAKGTETNALFLVF